MVGLGKESEPIRPKTTIPLPSPLPNLKPVRAQPIPEPDTIHFQAHFLGLPIKFGPMANWEFVQGEITILPLKARG